MDRLGGKENFSDKRANKNKGIEKRTEKKSEFLSKKFNIKVLRIPERENIKHEGENFKNKQIFFLAKIEVLNFLDWGLANMLYIYI